MSNQRRHGQNGFIPRSTYFTDLSIYGPGAGRRQCHDDNVIMSLMSSSLLSRGNDYLIGGSSRLGSPSWYASASLSGDARRMPSGISLRGTHDGSLGGRDGGGSSHANRPSLLSRDLIDGSSHSGSPSWYASANL